MSRKDRLGACESGEMKGGRGDICTREIKASGRPDQTRATLQEKERGKKREKGVPLVGYALSSYCFGRDRWARARLESLEARQ